MFRHVEKVQNHIKLARKSLIKIQPDHDIVQVRN